MDTSRSNNTVALETHALGTLKYIRASIEAAGAYAVPGIAGIAMGGVGVFATVLTSVPALAPHWFEIWLIAAVAASALGVVLVARQPTPAFTLYRGPARKFVLSLCPALLAGGVLTVILWERAQTELIPGAWLLLYGCAVLSASMMTVAAMMRLIATMGGLFMVCGLIAFAVPTVWQSWILGLGFGVLHLVFGVLVGRTRVE